MASSRRTTVFRVTGLPIGKAEGESQSILAETIQEQLTEEEKQRIKLEIACIPACDQSQTLCALVEFKNGNPSFLSTLDSKSLGAWQVDMGDEDISFDRHFFGFTQLYPTAPDLPVTADIIAITGLDGHAYGSWRGKGNLGRMWLRHFLSKDLPSCRTMIYGYNSKLSSHGLDTIMNYGRDFFEGIKRVRYTQELRERPIFFVAHSYGGIVLAHSLVKAIQTNEQDHPAIVALHKATYGILFFGTPHKGLMIDDIQCMLGNDGHHPRHELLREIEQKSNLLKYQLADFKNLIRDRKIISFFETQQTRRLEMNNETRDWGRTGPYITAVESDSALLQLPDSMETKIPVHEDHSQIVKFDSRTSDTYQTVIGYLKQFEKDGNRTVSARFSPSMVPAQRKLPTSTVPFDRDEEFVGRRDVLAQLESQYSYRDSHKRVVLVGLGGVGKSQIAIEWSYRLRAQDPMTWVFWVHGSTKNRFKQSYKSIAALLELPGWNDPKSDVLGLVSRWLSNVDNGHWFMILDNVDDIEVFCSLSDEDSEDQSLPLSNYIPQTATGSILLTTRDRRATTWLSTGFRSEITINVMIPEDAEELLRTKTPEGVSSSLEREELVKELDYVPLAITQAAAYISARASRMTVLTYLTLYRSDDSSRSRLLDEDSGDLRRDPGIPNSVIRTWQISFNQIKRKWPNAIELLSLVAMLDRQGIPKSLLSVRYASLFDFDKALDPLDEFSLITIEKGGESYEMHRLVQLAMRKWLEWYDDVERWQGEAVEVVSMAFPNGEYENWELCGKLLPHAQEVIQFELRSNTYCIEKASLLHRMAWYSWVQGHYMLAEAQSQEDLAIRKRLLNPDDLGIYSSLYMLALILQYQGKYDEAEMISRRALAGCEAVLGPEHPNTLMSVNNLASILQNQGKYDEAETMNRRVLAGHEVVLGPDHPNMLTSISNLAGILQDQGKYDEAETMNRRALAGREAVLGPEHRDTLTSISNLAGILQNQGKYNEAETMSRRALAGYEAVLGPEHPNTLTSVSNLALILQNQGKYDEAETMNRRALAGREAVLGPEHPDTLTSISNLAGILRNQGKYNEAETMSRRALAGSEVALGAEHPNTLRSVYSLAYLLWKREKYNDASILFRRACSGYQRQLRVNHPTTKACLGDYEAMCNEQERSKRYQ
ncbi:hypothetical protein BP5796_13224 [Coleophoma crateriformis]|uniref:NB-ARC domain-containing protein n=1 Tax=Coleophoma crateriformis TaxID=565419 RepID=A0A3D8Q3E1_9HELO|nr:hypothetical protein BP5796_13224 [Coleophoma crateriformis]